MMEESSDGSSALQRNTNYCVACRKRVCSNTVQVHWFPNSEELRDIWISTIRQHVNVEDWKWSQNSRVCGNHFLPVDYGTGKDTNKWRKRKSSAKQKLNKDAVPSVLTPFAPRPTRFASGEARSILRPSTRQQLSSHVLNSSTSGWGDKVCYQLLQVWEWWVQRKTTRQLASKCTINWARR